MQLYLQFGYGMKALTIDLAKKWGGVSVILSPRDMSPKQLEAWSKDFAKNGVSPPVEVAKNFSFVEQPESEALSIISELSFELLHKKYESEKEHSK